MKLRAIRLDEVGHFRSGVALEGLTGKLDVVPGPNEFGKSTLFRAIETVMRVPYTGTAANVRDLAPIQGGAPLIEVEFEIAGRRWRLRKRYLAQKAAELVDLDGSSVLRGADAESRLSALLAGRLGRDRMLGLLWVGQQESLDLPTDKQGELSRSLGRLIEDEIADAASEGTARRVREAVAGALEGLVSKATRRPAAGKPYKAAIDARNLARQAFDNAEATAREAARRLADLQAAQQRAGQLASPDAAAERAATLAGLRKSLADGVRAEEALQRAMLQVAARQAEHDKARDRSQRLAAAIAESAQLGERLQAAKAALATVRRDLDTRKAASETADKLRADAETRQGELQALLDAHDAHQRQQAAKAAQADVRRRLDVARTATARIAEIDAALAREPLTESVVADLRQTLAEVELLRARLDAALPKVRIDYAAGAAGNIRIDGAPVAASGDVPPAPTVALDIGGVGRITVSAPQAAGEDLAQQLAAASARGRALRVEVRVDDLTAAEARLEQRQRIVNERRTLADRLSVAAPQGLDELERQAAAVVAEMVVVAAPAGSRADVAEQLIAARAALRHCETVARASHEAIQEVASKEARLDAQIAGASLRLAQVEADLPPVGAREADSTAAKEMFAATEAALHAAVREQSAWAAAVLTPAARASLERELLSAERAERSNEEERQRVAFEINGLESALARDRQDGVNAAVEESRAALAAAQAQVDGFEREVAELLLIERLLDEEARGARESELKPMVERLQHYARGVFPDATFRLGDKLDVAGLVRQQGDISHQRLSGGTREQVAVLVRLAYARLLADRGEPLPLVLDDALVYADADRFRAMVDVLIEASEVHQVIVLTCHEERVAALGQRPGMAIARLRPWRPD